MIAWFTRNHVAANLLMVSVIAAGIYTLFFSNIPLEVFPSIESDRISVSVSLRGSTPEDSEKALATRIEEAISDLEGVEEYTSFSSEGGTQVNIEVADGYDPRAMLDDVKNRVDAINTLPSSAERPIVSLAVRRRNVITVTLSADVSELEMRQMIEQVREEILALPKVTQVQFSGVRDYEIAIEVSSDALRQYDISMQQIATALDESSLDLSGGSINTRGGDILLRAKGQAYHRNEYEAIVVKHASDGSVIKLGDIATVDDGFEEKNMGYRFNGKKAATVQIFRVGDQNAIDIADEVKDYVALKQEKLPQEYEITAWDDDSEIIKARLRTLTNSAIQGGILVFILLSLFLRPAVAFWVFIGIPVSFLGAFFMMPILGVTINLVSLFAFIVVLGIVVDDAIVTGENVYTHLRSSESGLDAAIRGTKEVSVPVTFGVLTTVAAFGALAFIDGQRGAIFAQIPAIVIPVLLFSLIESKFVLPAHLKYLKVSKSAPTQPNQLQRFQEKFAQGFETAILRYYRPALAYCLRRKGCTLALFWGLLICIVAAILVGHAQYRFFPRIPSETVRVNLTMSAGTPFEVTDRYIQQMTASAQFLRDKYVDPKTGQSAIMHILSRTGERGGNPHLGRVLIELVPPEDRLVDVDSQQIAKEWRTLIGVIPGAEEITFRAEIGRAGDPISIELRANKFDQLAQVSEAIKAKLATYPEVFDIHDSLAGGRQEIEIELNQEAHILGISRADIIRQVRNAFYGLEAQRIQRGRDDVRVMIRLPKQERTAVNHLNDLIITSDNGVNVPLSQIARLVPSSSPTEITRINGFRTLNVIADLEKDATNIGILMADLRVFIDDLIVKYPGVSYHFGGESEEEGESRHSLVIGLYAVLFIIYALLAIPFKSYLQPFIVMSIIPFGLIGAMIGHWVMGMNLSIMSFMGLLALVGVVVNDSLVLVDYINKTRLRGDDILTAVLTAGEARFRPVMLTSLTTFIGLMPLLFEKSTQAQILIPMAVSLGFGILFATFTTLILVPTHYLILESIKRRSQMLWQAVRLG